MVFFRIAALPSNYFEGLADLTPYAVEFRYEAARDDADGIEMDDASALVQGLLSEVRGLLGESDQD